jgi:hypothetical protein
MTTLLNLYFDVFGNLWNPGNPESWGGSEKYRFRKKGKLEIPIYIT